VVAGGIDVIYPPENGDLQRAIFESGALVTEMPPGVQPTQRHFPRRNRIISGLSLGVIVVEASPNSGSLITAHLALEQGREVFAVPGSPLDPRASGTNNLIRAGAHLTTAAEDVLNVLRDMSGGMKQPDQAIFGDALTSQPDESELQAARVKVAECLSPSPTNIDELIRDSHLSPALVSAVLLEFELAGRVERQPGNKVSLI
jgi:DNA processing protein